ncbi:MAG: hypothetical protein L6Q75_11620, partial [Burkholderiaceae bacterium]|nr:hypothetical protein [Burkholderiaceae bacterium]
MSASLRNKIAEVFDEPGCDNNQAKSEKERKKGCTKQLTPGAAAGGCAFDGAKIALQPIVDVAHLVHGPIACEGNSWDNRHSASSGAQTYRTGFTTDIHELDVIYGVGLAKFIPRDRPHGDERPTSIAIGRMLKSAKSSVQAPRPPDGRPTG